MSRLSVIAFLLAAASLVAWAKQPSSSSPRSASARKIRKPQPSADPAPGTAVSQPAPASSAMVSYDNGLLTITAESATLQQIVDKVRDSTGAIVEAPPFEERITVRLGPEPPAAVLSALLEGSHLNYIIIGDAGDAHVIRAIQIMPEPAPRPDSPAPPPSRQELEAAAEAARARALFVAQTGGDEGVWDNAPEPPSTPR